MLLEDSAGGPAGNKAPGRVKDEINRLGLLLVAVLAMVGSVIWVMVTESSGTPAIVYVIIGATVLGFFMLLAAAIRDRQNQKKTEKFEGRSN